MSSPASGSDAKEESVTDTGNLSGGGTEGQDKSLSMVQIAEMLSGLVGIVDPVPKKQREVLFNSLVGLYGMKVVHKDAFVTRKPRASGFEAAGVPKSGKTSGNGTKSTKSKGKGRPEPMKPTFDKKDPRWVKLQKDIQRSSDSMAASGDDAQKRERFATARRADVEKAKLLKIQLQSEQLENSKSS